MPSCISLLCLHGSKDAQLICRLVEYLLSQYAETLAVMLSIICAQSNEKAFAFPHKPSTALRCNECIFIHPPLFKHCSKRSWCLIEHYYLNKFVCLFVCWQNEKLKGGLIWEKNVFWGGFTTDQDFGFDKRGVSVRSGGPGRPVNALPTGRRRATKEAMAYSKATVQLLSHAKHSNVLCKGWAGRELREGLSHEGHLKHTQTKLKLLRLMQPDLGRFWMLCCGEKVWLKCLD